MDTKMLYFAASQIDRTGKIADKITIAFLLVCDIYPRDIAHIIIAYRGIDIRADILSHNPPLNDMVCYTYASHNEQADIAAFVLCKTFWPDIITRHRHAISAATAAEIATDNICTADFIVEFVTLYVPDANPRLRRYVIRSAITVAAAASSPATFEAMRRIAQHCAMHSDGRHPHNESPKQCFDRLCDIARAPWPQSVNEEKWISFTADMAAAEFIRPTDESFVAAAYLYQLWHRARQRRPS